MKISRITNYNDLKEEKARLKEKLEVNEAMIKADLAEMKSYFSFGSILKNAGGLLFSNGRNQSYMLNSGFNLGMQAIPFLFRRKKKSGSFKNILIERAVLAVAPKLLDIASRILMGISRNKSTTTIQTRTVVAEPHDKNNRALQSAVVETTYPTKK